MLILRALRTSLLHIFRLAVVVALLGLVTGIGHDDADKLIWDAILRFCIHALGAMAIAAPILGGTLLYRRIRATPPGSADKTGVRCLADVPNLHRTMLGSPLPADANRKYAAV